VDDVEILSVLENRKSNMTDMDKLFQEALGGLWNNPTYGGYSDPPRKDFAPVSNASGYDFPYQKNTPPIFPPTAPGPENPINMPWPLQTVTADLTDSFTYLLAAGNKIENCLKLNKKVSSKQKKKLNKLLSYTGQILGAIQNLDKQLTLSMDMSKELPASNPHQERDLNKGEFP
jgi:hypothetical protein